ncbi:MAG: pyrroline-5-carboxylate reductase [Bacteroidia bacterium]|nr:pyrroline-5-carboxylate reductase [Bacteroidia bacterium]
MNVLLIGAGNMGKTFGQGFIQTGTVSPTELYVLDRGAAKADSIKPFSANELKTSPDAFIRDMDLLIVCVKPQDFSALAQQIKPYLTEGQIVLSIMAGITVARLQQELGLPKVVRAMPNLPSQIGMGMTVFTISEEVSRVETFTVQNLLSTTGKVLFVEDEHLIDSSTAVSGSGPAYVFYVMQAMIDRAKTMGFKESEARMLVMQTFMGSIHLLQQYELSCEEWIKKVASKGGTTEAALHQFSAHELREGIWAGLDAAKNRAEELSKRA